MAKQAGRYVRSHRPAGNDERSVLYWMDNEFQKIENAINLYAPLSPSSSKADPRYGWKDNRADLSLSRGSGPNQPTWSNVYGNFYGYLFAANQSDELLVTYHIDHDHRPGTGLWIHAHVEPTDTGAGTIRIGFEVTWAKGHGQGEAFSVTNTATVYAEVATNGIAYEHLIAEISDADAALFNNVEPDTLVKVRVFRDGPHANDTYGSNCIISFVDCHYQTDRIATLNKAPDFYD